MEKSQLVYLIEDSTYCPEGEGKIIESYLGEVYSKVSKKLSRFGEPVDWLVIKSRSLFGVILNSQSFFEDRFEEALKSEINPNAKVIRNHSLIIGGAIYKEDIVGHINEKLGTNNVNISYLNTMDFGYRISLYNLDIPKE